MTTPIPVLVTGGAGYIGSHAVLALRDRGWPVAVIDDLSTGFRAAVPSDVPFYHGDIEDGPLLAAIFAEHGMGNGAGAVMHFAGSIMVPESVRNPLKYYHNNTAKSRDLLAACVAARVPHFIFSSTAAVYGVPSDEPVTEAYQTAPANPYGNSKLMFEAMLADVASAYPINYCALRYFNVAGADPAGRAGQSTAAATNLIKIATEVAVGKRPALEVFGDDWPTPDGTGVRDFIHVTDLADAHLCALEQLIAEPRNSYVFNCGYGRGHSVREVIAAVERVCRRRISCRVVGRRPGDIASMVANSTALRDRLGWRPRYADLDTIVETALAWEARGKTPVGNAA